VLINLHYWLSGSDLRWRYRGIGVSSTYMTRDDDLYQKNWSPAVRCFESIFTFGTVSHKRKHLQLSSCPHISLSYYKYWILDYIFQCEFLIKMSTNLTIVYIVTYTSDYWRGLDGMIGFIDHFYTRNYKWYSATGDLHTVIKTLGFSFSFSRILATDFNIVVIPVSLNPQHIWSLLLAA
jgi:hypothetical protein